MIKIGYLKIKNLYAEKDILLFKQCYALEKIHGTSVHLSFDGVDNVQYFSGGCTHELFIKLFDQDKILRTFQENFNGPVTIYGEGYGGKVNKMSKTYGLNLKFIAFDVRIGKAWLDVPKAEEIVGRFGLEFIDYKLINTDLTEINAERDRDSVQAVRNGIGPGKLREGIVLRPLIELTKNNGGRLICKHKRDEFRETKTPRIISDAELKVLKDAQAVTDEWCVPMRLEHVLDQATYEVSLNNMGAIIKDMIQDIYLESEGEIVQSKAITKAIGKKTVHIFKQHMMNLREDETI